MQATELMIKTFTGAAITPYLHSIARLSAEVFKEYPYLCDIDPEKEVIELHRYGEHEEAIAVLLFDGSEVVGAATGIPLKDDSNDLKAPFIARGMEVSSYYHFAEALLHKGFRGRGLGHHFYDIREDFARRCGYTYTCLFARDCEDITALQPKDYYPLEDFWRKKGYVHHRELQIKPLWPCSGDKEEKEHPCSFWIKRLAKSPY